LSIAKHVKLTQTSKDNVVKFLCPANDCQYAENGSKHFTSSKLLKQVSIELKGRVMYSEYLVFLYMCEVNNDGDDGVASNNSVALFMLLLT